MPATRQHPAAGLDATPPPACAPSRHARRRRWLGFAWLLALLFLAAGLALLDGTPRANEWREVETATIARNFLDEPDLLYPRINWGAPGPGYVETEFQLYPFAVQLLFRPFGVHLWLGQLLSLLISTLTVVQVFRLGRWLLPQPGAWFAALTFASSALVFRYAGAFMPDAAALLGYVTAAERFLAWQQNRRLPTLRAAGAALALAILLKPTTIHLGLWCCLLVWRRRGLRAVFAPRMLAFAAVALLPAVAFYAHAAGLHLHYGNTFGVISGGDFKWGGPSWWFDPRFYLALLRIDGWLALGLGGCLLAGIGLLARRSRSFRFVVPAWIGVVFVYYLIVARYASDETAATHYHLFGVVPTSLAAGAGAVMLPRWLRRHDWPRTVAAAVAGLLVLAMCAQQWRRDWRFAHSTIDPTLRTAGQALAALSQPDDLVVVTASSTRIAHGVIDNFEDPRVLWYAWRRGRILPADELTGARLRTDLRIGAEWLVVLDAVLPRARADFEAALHELPVAVRGDGFTIYHVDQH